MVLFYNGCILGSDKEYSWMEVVGGKIIQLGSSAPNVTTDSIDLGGKMVLPGFHDSHIHVLSLGRSLQRLNLNGCRSIKDMKSLLTNFAAQCPNKWIVGFGWNQDEMTDGRYPSKEDIDEVISNRPVVLFRACHHIGLVNSMALDILGISAHPENPPGGIIDLKKGEPTGILRENALSIVNHAIKVEEDSKSVLSFLKAGLQECLKFGITSVQTNDSKAWEAYCKLDDDGELPLSVYLTFPANEVKDTDFPLPGMRHGKVHASRVKLFTDGSLGASTAALNAPYSDGSGGESPSGVLLYSDEELFKEVSILNSKGWRVEIHAIGDKAAEQVIQVFKSLPMERPVLTHGQVLSERAFDELKNSNIIVNIQPVFVGTDSKFADSRLGERVKYAYSWKKLLDLGVAIAGGSDAPIESPNPLLGMYQAIFRKKDDTGVAWRKEECLNFQESLSLFTERGAYAAGVEDHSGKLEVGYDADFLVLSENVRDNPEKLLTAEILEVYKAGIKVYSLVS